ncbi:hypothetical protein O1L44_22545 [Streptomyces noursei]|uniref:hypothetical protein n=1 Tax=Streptomyces noursei TaxID=1971 RepID=UPI00081D013A|nr:hypothetical protein SNOUR_26915 [Streptomyces noursei ATCC 11455]MCZ0995314.1 hypothetical protein [Streptomyces noursei]
MISRVLARKRLTIRYWGGWVATRHGRPIGPRPILALHRTPDPNCLDCEGTGEVMCGSPGQEEPDYGDCHCAPFPPLAYLWLPKCPAWLRQRRLGHDPAFSDEPPF